MKLVSYLKEERDQLAILENNLLYDTDLLHVEMPSSISMFLNYWEDSYTLASKLRQAIIDERIGKAKGYPAGQAHLLAPVPFPPSCRDGVVFINHYSVQGPGPVRCMPDHFNKLDFELEVAIVIAKPGRNIPAEEADEYIAGLMIMNAFNAYTLQDENTPLNISAVKSKGFATATGPWLVTLDELEEFEVPAKENNVGKSWNLSTKCSINGAIINESNLSNIEFTFAELIERASYGATLYPGDIIASGVTGKGCLLSINKSGKLNDENYTEQWLQPGDIIELEVEGLGKLVNTIEKENSGFSILNRKQ